MAANVLRIGAACDVIGFAGDDHPGRVLREGIESLEGGAVRARLVDTPGRPTTTKTRVMARKQQVVRFDREHDDDLAPAGARGIRDGRRIAKDAAWTPMPPTLRCSHAVSTLNPRSVSALQNKSHVLGKLGRSAECVQVLDRILELAPDSAVAKSRLNTTPDPEVSPLLPKTICCTLTAVPHASGIPFSRR